MSEYDYLQRKNRLKELRTSKNLTLRELGKEVGMRDNTLSQYENGKREPKFETWQKLADFFGVSVPYLQGIDDEDYIEFACNECGYTFKAPRELETKVVSCPFCSCQETSYEV